MDCQIFERQIQAYLDGRLSAPDREALLNHTRRCPDCAALLADFEALETLLAAELTLVEPPADFAANVMAALPPAYHKKVVSLQTRRRKRWLQWGSAAAAAVLMLAVAVSGLWPGGGSDNPLPDANPIVADVSNFDHWPGSQLPNLPGRDNGTLLPPNPVVDQLEEPGSNGNPNQEQPVIGEVDPAVDPTPDPSAGEEQQPVTPPDTEPTGEETGNGTTNAPDLPAQNVDHTVDPPQPSDISAPLNVNEGDAGTDDTGLVSGEIDMPQPAISSEEVGEFKLMRLAAYDSLDAILPSFNAAAGEDGLVEFYTLYRGSYRKWTQTLDGKSKPVYENVVTNIPSVTSLTKSEDNTSVVGVSTFTAASPDNRLQAVNMGGANGGVWIVSNTDTTDPLTDSAALSADELASSAIYVGSGGGQLISWSANNNKLLYTDAAGKLYIYYLAERATIASVFDGTVSCAVWLPDSKTILFAGTPKGSVYSSIYKATLP